MPYLKNFKCVVDAVSSYILNWIYWNTQKGPDKFAVNFKTNKKFEDLSLSALNKATP